MIYLLKGDERLRTEGELKVMSHYQCARSLVILTNKQLFAAGFMHVSVTLQRPSARVAANMVHLSLWGRKALANQDSAGMRKLVDWLLCQSAVVLLKGCSGPSGNTAEAELQRSFLSNLDLEDLRTAVGFLLHGREQRQACILSA